MLITLDGPPAIRTPERPEIVDAATRRQFLGVLAGAGLLAGCGANAAPPVADGAGYPRQVVDGLDVSVTVPLRPERIAVLDSHATIEALLSLGVVPVQIGQRSYAAEVLSGTLPLFPWVADALARLGADPEIVNADELSIEAVARSRPDLIVGADWMVESGGDPLRSLAPTLATEWGGVRTAITMLGQALAQEDTAARVLADFDATLAGRIDGSAPPGATIAFLEPNSSGTIDSSTDPASWSGLFTRAGFAIPQAIRDADAAGEGFVNVSWERLGLFDGADVLVVFDFVGAETTDALLASDLFARLPAAAGGRVIVVRGRDSVDNEALFSASPLNVDVALPYVERAVELARRS